MTPFVEQQQSAWASHYQQPSNNKNTDRVATVNSMTSLASQQQQSEVSASTASSTNPAAYEVDEITDTSKQHTLPDQQQQQQQQQQLPVRKRTRATADQLSVLEDTFAVNVSPNSKLRKQLAEQLNMSERSIQIWFQNRRAKVKHMQKRAQMQMHQATLRAQLYHHQQQQYSNHYMNGYYYPYPPPPPPPHHFNPSHSRPHYSYPYLHPHERHTAMSSHHHHQQPVMPPAMPMTRAQSVDDAIFQQQQQQQQVHRQRPYHPPICPHPGSHSTPSASGTLPPPITTASQPTIVSVTPSPWQGSSSSSSSSSSNSSELQPMSLCRQSMPPRVYDTFMGLEFPEYFDTPTPPPATTMMPITSATTSHNSNIPTLTSVPDAGPTAMLTSSIKQCSLPPSSSTMDDKHAIPDGYTFSLYRSSPTSEAVQMERLPTIDPSTLLMKTTGTASAVEEVSTGVAAAVNSPADAEKEGVVAAAEPAASITSPSSSKDGNIPTTITTNKEDKESCIDKHASSHKTSNKASDSPVTYKSSLLPEVEQLRNKAQMKEQQAAENDSNITTPTTQEQEEEPEDLYFSAHTLTIGTWHRFKNISQPLEITTSHAAPTLPTMAPAPAADLVCVYCPDKKLFAWHIIDSGCHFKMEVAQEAISGIEFISIEQQHQQPTATAATTTPPTMIAQVHFDISEPPLFYMESSIPPPQQQQYQQESDQQRKNKRKKPNPTTNLVNEQQTEIATVSPAPSDHQTIATPVWVQCSDFTEGKQASRYFRHTIQGDAYHLKQELMALVNNHEETRRIVHFIDTTAPDSSLAPSHLQPHTAAFIYPPPPPSTLTQQQYPQQSGYIVRPHQLTDFYTVPTPSFYSSGMLLDYPNAMPVDYPTEMMDMVVAATTASMPTNNHLHHSDTTMTGSYTADTSANNACEMYMS